MSTASEELSLALDELSKRLSSYVHTTYELRLKRDAKERRARFDAAVARYQREKALLEEEESKPQPIQVVEPTRPSQRFWFHITEDQMGVRPVLMIAGIQESVAVHFGITRTDLLSARRTANVVRPRQVAMYLAKTLTLRSLPEIGRSFGGRDHTTVLHAVRKIECLMHKDPGLRELVEGIERELRGQVAQCASMNTRHRGHDSEASLTKSAVGGARNSSIFRTQSARSLIVAER
jgi:hypothetical protein